MTFSFKTKFNQISEKIKKYNSKRQENSKKYKSELAIESANCFARPFVEMKQAFQR